MQAELRGVYGVFEEHVVEHVVDALVLVSEPFQVVNDYVYVDGVMVMNVQDISISKYVIYAETQLRNNKYLVEVLIYVGIPYKIIC